MILFVGVANSQLVELAKHKDTNAVLINEDNINTDVSVGYTGLEEFVNKNLFLDLLLSAEEIFYHPETFTQSQFDLYNPTNSSQGLTENFLLLAKQQGVRIHNLTFLGQKTIDSNRKNYLELADVRKNIAGPQIWGVGCSFTQGVGVTVDQRYINLLGKQLNMPVNCLAISGTSIAWAADQILRSDIRAGDIVVWGITSKYRLPWVLENKVKHASINWIDKAPKPYQKLLAQLLTDDSNLEYQQITSINQVTNFCEKVGVQLVLLGILTLPTDLLYLTDNPYFYQCYQCSNNYLDLGDDNHHPGPKQHQLYANIVYSRLQK